MVNRSQKTRRTGKAVLLTCSVLLAGGTLKNALGSTPATLEAVYLNDDFQLTGVSVSRSGRLFVNFPRWSDHYLNAVVEVKGGNSVTPFPDETWNRWDGKVETAGKQFVCVQSVVVDDEDTLWVVDAAAPLQGPVVSGGPKLVAVDLRSNQVTRVFLLGSKAVLPNSYLNDVRVDTARHTAYLTDSGAGGLVVLDLATGSAHRALDGDASVSAVPGIDIVIDGKPLKGANGKPPQVNSDGIALSPGGQYLYYQALTSKTLYRIKAELLRNEHARPEELRAAIETVATTFPTDGLWMDKKGVLYLTGLTQNAVLRLTAEGKTEVVAADSRLQWPDTLTQGTDGTLYISASHINESPRFNLGKSIRKQPYGIFKFKP